MGAGADHFVAALALEGGLAAGGRVIEVLTDSGGWDTPRRRPTASGTHFLVWSKCFRLGGG
jgi:hypothetical protein